MQSRPSADPSRPSATISYFLELKQTADVQAFEKFSKYVKAAGLAVTMEDISVIYGEAPHFAHKLVKANPQLIKTKKDIAGLIKLDPMLVFSLLDHVNKLLTDKMLADFCRHYVRKFRVDFMQKTLANLSIEALKKLLKTELGHDVLRWFPPTSPKGKQIAQCLEVTSVINGPAALEALEKDNKKAGQQPTMATTLLLYHPQIVKMKLMLTSPVDPITDLLIAKAIEFNIFKDFVFFKNLLKVNWNMAARLLQHDLIVKQLQNKWSEVKTLPYQWLRDLYGFDQPEKKLISLDHLHYLDLATHPAKSTKSHNDFDFTMKKTLSKKEKIKQQIAADFFTTRDYFFEMMYGKTGYYTTGKVAFAKDAKDKTENSDFRTTASNIKTRATFAAIFAEQLFQFRKQMIAKGTTKKTAPFNVLECGAGDGDLCAAIFSATLKMVETGDPEWQAFYDCLQYHILEKSPALLARQKKNTLAYAKKITYTEGDAMALEKMGAESMAVVISNELLDMFPPDRIVFDKNGTGYNIMMVPALTEALYYKFFYAYYEAKEKGLGDKRLALLKEKSLRHKNNLQGTLSDRIKESAKYQQAIVLDKKDFLELHALYAADHRFAPQDNVRDEIRIFDFFNARVELPYFPKLHQFIAQSSDEFTATLKVGEEKLVSTGVEDFLRGVNTILQKEGFVLTVDYGGATNDMSKSLRTVRGKLGHDITRTPGFIDITYDVNFTSLQEIGRRYGLQLIEYKKQADMMTHELQAQFIKKGLLTEKDFEQFAQKSPSFFKVCIQAKTSSSPEKKPANIPITYQDEFRQYRGQFTLFLQPASAQQLIADELKRISGTEWKIIENGNVALSKVTDKALLTKLHQHFVTQRMQTRSDLATGHIKIQVPWLEILRTIPPLSHDGPQHTSSA